MQYSLRFAVGVATLSILTAAVAAAAKPEDVFKGKVIITNNRLPIKFSSAGEFIAAVRRAATDRVWPTSQKGNDHAEWNVEYIAFFAQPLNDNELLVKFFDVTPGTGQKYVAGDEQYMREKGSRIFASNIKVARPEFEVNHRYLMTLESGRRVLARTTFWLRGKGLNYTGRVEFSDDEARRGP